MVEKGVLVEDAATGESIACRDAKQTDDDNNSRIIQLFDKAARPVIYQLTTPLRPGVSDSDSLTIDPLTIDIYDHLLTVSDAESVVVWAKITSDTYTNTTEFITVTPLIVTDDTVVGDIKVAALLPPFVLRPVYPKTMTFSTEGVDALHHSTYVFPSLINSFPTFGANRIGFHIMLTLDALNDAANLSVDLFAAATSGACRNTAIDQDMLNGTWGAAFGDKTVGGE